MCRLGMVALCHLPFFPCQAQHMDAPLSILWDVPGDTDNSYLMQTSCPRCSAWREALVACCRLSGVELDGRGHGGELRGPGAVSGGSVAARAAGGLAPILRMEKRQAAE